MNSNTQLSMSKEYQTLLIQDFRRKVYPLAIACAVIFAVFFLVNASGIANPKFALPDAIAAVLFAALAQAVKRGSVLPHVGSIFILGVVTAFYTTVILYSGSIHGILFFYCTIPFFAFYMAGSRVGLVQGLSMLVILYALWGASTLTWVEISYSNLEMGIVSFLLLFSVLSAWGFERVRERTFNDSYQSGLRHETLMEALDEVYYRVGMDGIIQEIGEAIFTITGYTPREAEGTQISTFYANADTREGYINALKKTGSVKNYPIELRGKQGNLVMISMSSRMFFDESGKPIYIEGLIRDITKEREIERERAENLDHLRALSVIENKLANQDFESSIMQSLHEMLSMFAVDRVFLVPLCLKRQSDVFEKCYEKVFVARSNPNSSFDANAFVHEDEIVSYLSSIPQDLEHASYTIDAQDMISQHLVHQYQIKSQMMVVFRIKPDVIWLLGAHSSEKTLDFGRKKQLFIDISHRVRGALSQLVLQKDLQATVERVEIASRAKSEFLATMSHELRTPLHGVIGLLDLLGEDIDRLSQEQQRNLLLAQTSSHVLSSLIDDVLDLAKIESGKVELQKQSFVLKDALHDALVPFVMKAREKGLNLSLEMKGVPAVIEGDVVRLRQVLLNLVGNAIKFTDQGYVRIIVTKDDGMLQINIEDSGIGIEKVQHDKVFKPFSQVHDINILGENLQEKGTGLGTTISLHFVEMMGGSLSLQSVPNVGSTLSIRIPLQNHEDKIVDVMLDMEDFVKLPDLLDDKRLQKWKENIQVKDWKVLLAEDDPVGRRIAVKRLEKAGFEVTTVADGDLAWQKLQEDRFDLLLTDIRMPGLDGMELTKAIRKFELEHNRDAMLIIGLSAYALEEVKNDALACGMNEFISKPVDMVALMSKLEATHEAEEASDNQGV